MRKRGFGWMWIVLITVGIVAVFVILVYSLSYITVTQISFSIEDGKLTEASIKEGEVSRMGFLWQKVNIDKGYYDVEVGFNNEPIRIENFGSSSKNLYIQDFINCADIIVYDSKGEKLDEREVCK